ncbi:DNA processing protein dpra, putative [Heliomicrobium modesticaldum Ice1]|uniref:DNA processing protein dpra, putative n=1 Tax=Heliobacterium modesticaldum (strain ATCC 51547 / Ice1) TaxID=498761 RepID=B0TH91_HELMI|nr:DNA-processing protein DprA [Heliomicrobium modesticaldum]ABZ84766.1 DNA processing protein dpra, putative [Heliomicrobium modesticaldum Ice1]
MTHPPALSERDSWIALSALPGIGPRRFYALLGHFGTARNAWLAADERWDGVAGLSRQGWERTLQARRRADRVTVLLRRLTQGDIAAVLLIDEQYPALLRSIPDPPPVLYVRGKLTAEDESAFAIVGTRKPSAYGVKACAAIARDLAQHGRTVVSGMARGIDGIAHQSALEAGGRTIAVLAGGVDVIYPPEHGKLASRIVEQGALVSEYPPGKRPEPGTFPVRNRIISGLSNGVIVVEAGEKSGALITADQALEQGRDVFAVPGPITLPQSIGTNRLIQQGAKLVITVEDILDEVQRQLTLPLSAPAHSSDEQLSENRLSSDQSEAERRILEILDWEPRSADELAARLGLSGSEVAAALTLLELKGRVQMERGGGFVAV